MEKIRVIIWGLGAMGGGMARMILQKKGMEIVGAIASRPEKSGKDLGEVLDLGLKTGVTISCDPETVLKQPADIVLLATSSFTREVYPQLQRIIASGKNVITIAEEMAYPAYREPELAAKIDKMAKDHGVTVLGTGINPGFVLDTLIIALSGVCMDIKKITARRINDLSPFGTTVMRTQGVGTTVDEFRKGLEEGTIVGHIGFPESISLISEALGLEIDEIREMREPIVSNVYRETPYARVEPGMVAGCKHTGIGYRKGEPVIVLEHPQQIRPELEDVETGDYIEIEGTPNIKLSIKPEIPGGIGTIAIAVNMIPKVISANTGLVTMKDLPVPAALMGDIRKLAKDGVNNA
ncbi:2,4-diaminopentanoate dehydrogenase [Thermosediminibacter oceani]|uniref:Dihydrodipicolinate reductase n=1 Tax=Thermosediminibacter oceani (strain ATCC BAA-1034 / DSM 16646 / JW/IW-1228P) TaxID=555079 RepID=D9RY14_THEOJ|nr:2,4-diaminopentanoate dehydrogenase [Thermosediminibacter oceani]ADL08238.1 dihydrodipicolinate reductase [Thermosediminibacter oceani DSM 16646]